MNTRYTILFLSAFALVLVTACSEDTKVTDPNHGSVSATSYVAVGNSITAGVQNSAMYGAAQQYSYPALIAQQIGADFTQPLISGKGLGERVYLVSLNPVTVVADSMNYAFPSNSDLAQPYNNLGVPGAIAADLMDENALLLRANQAFSIVMRDQAYGASVVKQAMNLMPTIMTLWIGNNDVLGYAASGGTDGTDATGTLPTETSVFTSQLSAALDYIQMVMPATKVVLGNIPAITSIPYFTTVPTTMYQDGLPVYIWIMDKNGTIRKALDGDYLLLTAQEYLKQNIGFSEQSPLPNKVVLDSEEAAIVAQAVTSLNAAIDMQASSHGYVVADMYGMYNEIRDNGYSVAGETFTVDYISGGLFSFDGMHPSSKGMGIIANKFIQTMNNAYSANLRFVNIAALPGLEAPNTSLGLSKERLSYSRDWDIPSAVFSRIAGASR